MERGTYGRLSEIFGLKQIPQRLSAWPSRRLVFTPLPIISANLVRTFPYGRTYTRSSHFLLTRLLQMTLSGLRLHSDCFPSVIGIFDITY
ncbi:MAG: hypothetical protein JW384_00394 [Nitrosomonadaceae bacterium]|nr:hypothetical protein [Nitrosomonadaceae bacterium]